MQNFGHKHCAVVENDKAFEPINNAVVNKSPLKLGNDDSIANTNVMQKISDVVDQMRIEHDDDCTPQPRSMVNAPGFEEVQRRVDQTIIQAEKFKVTVEKPSPGMTVVPFDISVIENNQKQKQHNVSPVLLAHNVVGTGLSDDDFFHQTCHIDSNLRSKISKGEFVDLDKLLPKDRLFDSSNQYTNETKLEWVQSEGGTYLVPAKKTSRINCFRKWEQAFRMYPTIYCTENPLRAREIWQYISVINTASLAYSWENVYNYDIIFRQLMEFNPTRSWAVTYNQMWNLLMTNPITGNGQRQRNSFGQGFH